MPEYRRIYQSGGTYFSTVVTHRRRRIFADSRAVDMLREAFLEIQADTPFDMSACVVLPDHLHCIWTMPEGDSAYSTRWSRVKRRFTQRWLASGGHEGGISESRAKHRERGVWQRRFWEHTIRNEDDMIRHVDYIHFNPVKHGLASCPHAWSHSSFDRWVKSRHYTADWLCGCDGKKPRIPDFSAIETSTPE